MSQLTREEKKLIEELNQEMANFSKPDIKILALKSAVLIINRLSARVEELERDLRQQETLKEVKERVAQSFLKMERDTLQSNLSTLLSAVEPIESVVKILDGWADAYQAIVTLSVLRTLSTVAAEIKR